MLARGEVAATGVLAPETCLDPARILDALCERGPVIGWPPHIDSRASRLA
jgi:hypothetical protein